jgi:hypothetical protein
MIPFIVITAFLLLARVVDATIPTSTVVWVQDLVHYDDNGYFSTNFVGLNLPSSGNAEIIFFAGDWANNNYVIGEPDEFQYGYGSLYTGAPTNYTLTIGAAGHYWVYCTEYGGGTWYNFDWLEIYILPSTNTNPISCYYCNPPYPNDDWMIGYPPIGSFDTVEGPSTTLTTPPQSQASQTPKWLVPLLAVIIGVAIIVPVSYLVIQRRRKQQAQAQEAAPVEMQAVATSA